MIHDSKILMVLLVEIKGITPTVKFIKLWNPTRIILPNPHNGLHISHTPSGVIIRNIINFFISKFPIPRVTVGVIDDIIKSPGSLDLYRINLVPVASKIMNEVGLCPVFLIGDENGFSSVLDYCAELLHISYTPFGVLFAFAVSFRTPS